jgi:hypothetical protein
MPLRSAGYDSVHDETREYLILYKIYIPCQMTCTNIGLVGSLLGKKYIYICECFNNYRPLSIIRGRINRSSPHPHTDVPTKKLHVNGAWFSVDRSL